MDRITLQNYRCFGSEEQSARLAPLTLLVGPNSTGKTSFLALIRALWDVAFHEIVPNFRQAPYDLGAFDDIVYDPGGKQRKSDWFGAGFQYTPVINTEAGTIQFDAVFRNKWAAPFPVRRRAGNDLIWVVIPEPTEGGDQVVHYQTNDHEWDEEFIGIGSLTQPDTLFAWWQTQFVSEFFSESGQNASSSDPNESHFFELRLLRAEFGANWQRHRRLSAGAAVRSRPHRTYDPALLAGDPEGDYVPSYLANLSRRNADEWQLLKRELEAFGTASELFDEIQVRSFGRSDGDPFQIQVRKHSGPKSRRRKGPWRNLIDVGYGVSQALPVLTELLRPDGPTMFLLQQPEVHLHPQAQAALGTLFCQVAAGGRQLVIETHSDYIIDRVRMDVRDGTTGLKPEDVSILYFEPGDLAVKIHSIRMDKMGNVLDAPPSYGKFFMEEINRSIGLIKPDVRNS